MNNFLKDLANVITVAFEECCITRPDFSVCMLVDPTGLYTVFAATAKKDGIEMAVAIPTGCDDEPQESYDLENVENDMEWDGYVTLTYESETVRTKLINLIDTLQALKDKLKNKVQ